MPGKSVDIYIKAHDQVTSELGGIQKSVGALKNMLVGAAAAIGVSFGIEQIKNAAKAALDAYGEEQAAIAKLQQSLANLGAQSETQGLLQYADELEKMTVVSHDTITGMMQLGAAMGNLSGDKLKQATQAAIGFSRAFGIDAETAMKMVSKAAEGNYTAMSRYGVQINKNASDEEKWQAVMARGAEAFKVARSESGTYTGAMASLKNAVHTMAEEAGKQLAPMVIAIANTIKENMPVIKEFVAGLIDGFKNILKVGLVIYTFYETEIKHWKDGLLLAFTAVRLAVTVFVNDVIYFFSKKLPAYVDWFKDHWKEVLNRMIENFKHLVDNVATNLYGLWEAIKGFLKGEGFDFKWTALTEGFEDALKGLPEIAERELTASEKDMSKTVRDLAGKIGRSFMEDLRKNFGTWGLLPGSPAGGTPPVPGLPPGAEPPSGLPPGAEPPPGAGGRTVESLRGGELTAYESASRIYAKGQDVAVKQLSVLNRICAALEQTNKTQERHASRTEMFAGLSGIGMANLPAGIC